jgi:UTP-glucose-1-phosphate uridylyltransferase
LTPKKVEDGVYKLKSIVEKPKYADAPSNMAVIGRYNFSRGRNFSGAIEEIQTPGWRAANINTCRSGNGEIRKY